MTQRRVYQNEFPYFVTFRIREGFPLFEKTKYAVLLSDIIFEAGRLKQFEILSYQIMPDHVHILAHKRINTSIINDRTLEKVRSVTDINNSIPSERTLSSVRSNNKKEYNISDLIQSIKGNFSRQLHMGNIFQPRFYTRIITTRKYLRTVVEYIKYNPIKAELPAKYHQAPYRYFDWEEINNLF